MTEAQRVEPQPHWRGQTPAGVDVWYWQTVADGREINALWHGDYPFALIADFAPNRSNMILRDGVWYWSERDDDGQRVKA